MSQMIEDVGGRGCARVLPSTWCMSACSIMQHHAGSCSQAAPSSRRRTAATPAALQPEPYIISDGRTQPQPTPLPTPQQSVHTHMGWARPAVGHRLCVLLKPKSPFVT
mmetsp:Transcript_30259/g.97715  ORF Transcript_30259/g.97715 Transcript_30259/m.97715 type:complete len:108 (-) Transcript_30259:2068-2391(-)